MPPEARILTKIRSWQGSNLRGQSPLDFKSNALTTRPQLLAASVADKKWRCGGSNPGPFTCKANALPLSYIPAHGGPWQKWGPQPCLAFASSPHCA